MDMVKLDILSHYHWNIVRKILIVAAQRKLKPIHPLVVQEVMVHFNFSPTPNDNFNKPVDELAESCQSSL